MSKPITKKINAGYSLAEVVISITLTVIITAAVLTSVLAVNQTLRRAQNSTAIQTVADGFVQSFETALTANNENLLNEFERNLKFCLREAGLNAPSGDLFNGLVYDYSFSQGEVECTVIQSQSQYQLTVTGKLANSNKTLCQIIRSYAVG